MKRIVSFSGGKDSTAMLLRMVEDNIPFDEVVMFDTGWEFPQMHEHVLQVQDYIELPITVLHPRRSFESWMIEWPIVSKKDRPNGILKGEVYRVGCGWPSPMRRWCTSEKIQRIDTHCGGSCCVSFIGFAADEIQRKERWIKNNPKRTGIFPLIDWDMTEADCLAYCVERGFDWGGLYDHFKRVSCFCCPLQPLPELRILRTYYPDLWARMLEWEDRMGSNNRGFKDYVTVHDLDRRFHKEDMLKSHGVDNPSAFDLKRMPLLTYETAVVA